MKAGAALGGMPRCEGRSDGPGHHQQCPENRNDSTVHRSQGDLMLCNACELYRFPALAAAGSKTDVTLASRRRKGSMATTSSHSSTTTTRPNTRKGQQTVKSRPSADDDGGDSPVVAATTRGSDARRHPGDSDTDSQVCCKNADTNILTGKKLPTNKNNKHVTKYKSDSSGSDDSDSESQICISCLSSVCTSDRCLKCTICLNMMHVDCTCIPAEAHDIMINYAAAIGYVCDNCRHSLTSMKNRYDVALNAITEEVAILRAELCNLRKDSDVVVFEEIKQLRSEFELLKCSKDPPVLAGDSTALQSDSDTNIFHPQGEIPMTIHRTLNDISRRKCNVIVTGLPETADDETLFIKFCEENLSVKPSVINRGCRRLGAKKRNDPRPRRLLVQLTSESNAANLIYVSKELKDSDEEFARSIYINRDLTPAEAKMAYEKRQQRRLKRAKVPSTPAQVSTSTSSAATTVLMTSNNTATVSNQGTDNSVHISTGTTVCSTVHQQEVSSIDNGNDNGNDGNITGSNVADTVFS